MRYSYEFKLRYVELYKEGSQMETPENVKTKFFRDKIRQWCRIADSCGSQVLKHYQHEFYRKTLKKHGIIQSMSRKGNCYDNCIMETFFGRLKTEIYYDHESEYKSFEVFSVAVKEYIRL